MPAPGRRFKNAVFERFARIGKALASSHRIELVELLSRGPRTVDAKALHAKVRGGEVTPLDLRPEEEFAAGHLPGALSVPPPALVRRLSEQRRRREVVAHCPGPSCVLAVEAVERLGARGFKAVRPGDGVLDRASLWTQGRRLTVTAADTLRPTRTSAGSIP